MGRGTRAIAIAAAAQLLLTLSPIFLYSAPTKLNIMGPNEITDTMCGMFGVETRNANDFSESVSNNTTVNLSDGGGGGSFYSDINCTAATASITLNAGMGYGNFYYKKATAGGVILIASAAGLEVGSRTINVTSGSPPPPPPPPQGTSCTPTSTTRTVSGSARDSNGQPLASVTVKIQRQGCEGNAMPIIGTTNGAGNFSIASISTNTHIVDFYLYGYFFNPNFIAIAAEGAVAVPVSTGTSYTTGGPTPENPASYVTSSTTLMGGTTAQIYNSTSTYNLNFAGMPMVMPPNTNMGVYTNAQGEVILISTKTADVTIGSYLNCEVPPNYNIAIDTTAAGAYIFTSTAPQTPLNFGNGQINFSLPPGMQTTVVPSSTGVMLQTTGQAQVPYGNNIIIQTPPNTAVNIATTAVSQTWVFNSTAATNLKFGGDKINFQLPPGADMTIKELTAGLVMKGTSTMSVPYGNNMTIEIPAAVNMNISTNTPLSGGWLFMSTAANTSLKFAGNKIDFRLPADANVAIRENSSGIVFQTTGSYSLPYGNNLNIQTGAGSNITIATHTTLSDGWVFSSTNTNTALRFAAGKINFSLPSLDLSVKETAGGAGIILQSTGTTQIDYGANLDIVMPTATSVSISTNSPFTGGWTFTSTSTLAGLKFADGKIDFKIPRGIDTAIKEDATGIVMLTSTSATAPYGTSLALGLSSSTEMRVSTASAFTGGSVAISTAQFNLSVASATLTIPASTGVDFKETGSGQVVLRSTANASTTLTWNSNVDLTLPSVHVDLTSRASNDIVLGSTQALTLKSAGATVTPSSGSIEAINTQSQFTVSLQTATVQTCALTLPTTAQKTIEVELSRGTSTAAVSVSIEPDALTQNAQMDIKIATTTPSVTLSTAGQTLSVLGSGLAVEITPATAVGVDNSTGVPLTFTYQDSDLAGRTTDSLKVCVFSTTTVSWEVLPTVVNASSRTLTAYAPHFSLFQAMSLLSPTAFSSSTAITPDISTTIAHSPPKGEVTIDIPAGAFAEAVTLTLSTPTAYPSAASPGGGNLNAMGVGIELTLSKSIQPLKDVTLTIGYPQGDVGTLDESKLIIARYDSGKNVWVPLVSTADPTNNKVTGKTNHFSIFQIMEAAPSSSVKDARVFPNPFMPPKGHLLVTFAKMPASASIKIYTLSGVLVKELTSNANGMASWDGKNSAGENAASGVYFAFIEGTGGKNTLKVAIQR